MTEQIFAEPTQLVFLQSRAATNYKLVDEYAEIMQNEVQFEATQGIRDKTGQVYIWDGLHRGEAAKRVGTLLLVSITPGTKEEAEWLALTANQKHGLRRSRADLQRIVRLALLHPNGADLSDREIARHCGVSDKTVGKIRSTLEVSAEIPQIATRLVTRNGRTYALDISNIGQNKTADSFTHTPELSEVGHSLNPGRPPQNQSLIHEKLAGAYEPTDYEPKALEFECPRCGKESIVGVNGSRRWCLNCSAEWSTVASFLAEVQTLPAPVRLTREHLLSRFEGILMRLNEVEQLDKIEIWLNNLEDELLVKEMKG